jgi:Beta-galactosidase
MFKFSIIFCIVFSFCLKQTVANRSFNPNDSIFPPSKAAKLYIDFDGKGFVINGKRTFITSGGIHYPRVPRENWHDILLKLKRCGFNTVETYMFWNYHEANEGQFDFTSGSHDCGAFLDEARSLGLYAIVRVGPYACAEWENGGFPTWLYFKPGLEIRKDNKPFYEYLDKWFDKMLPIVSQRQIHKGGNVILVQLENEQPTDKWRHWGTDMDGAYFKHLLDKAHQHGLEVPMYFSGLHHDHNPAPDNPVDPTTRQSPWMSMELWTTWFDKYGNEGDDLVNSTRHPWRVLAYGGSGFNLYMFHGGTNFGYSNFSNKEVANKPAETGGTSYDYGTLIGQTGETRELYLNMKRLAYFAETFSPILAGSVNSTDLYRDFASDVAVTARTAPEGTIVFLDNGKPTVPGDKIVSVLKSGLKIGLEKGEIVAFPMNYLVTPDIKIALAETRILGIVDHGKEKTVVCYGNPGEAGRVTFEKAGKLEVINGASTGFKLGTNNKSQLNFNYPDGQIGEAMLQSGSSKIRILVMAESTANKTWFVDTPTGRQIVVGAPYLSDCATKATGSLQLTVDYTWNEQAPKELIVFGDDGRKILKMSSPEAKEPQSILLENWKWSLLNSPVQPNFDDSSWFCPKDGHLPVIGEDGVNTAYAWYRTALKTDEDIESLSFSRIGDRATFFVNGKALAEFDNEKDTPPEIKINIPKGDHELTVFVSHFGRKKFDGYVGPLNIPVAQKGLRSPVKINGNKELNVEWKMKGIEDPQFHQLQWSSSSDKKSEIPRYFYTRFYMNNLPESGIVYRLVPEGLSHGSVWLNGRNIGRYPELIKNCPGIWLPSCWMKKGENSLMIFDEKGNSPEKIKVELERSVSRYQATYVD